jgi:hypothetical protein
MCWCLLIFKNVELVKEGFCWFVRNPPFPYFCWSKLIVFVELFKVAVVEDMLYGIEEKFEMAWVLFRVRVFLCLYRPLEVFFPSIR